MSTALDMSGRDEADESWLVVVVDDDEDVFRITELVLRRMRVLDRPIRLLHCGSASEARATLQRVRDVGV